MTDSAESLVGRLRTQADWVQSYMNIETDECSLLQEAAATISTLQARVAELEEERDERISLQHSAEMDCERSIRRADKAELDLKCLEESTVDSKAYDALRAELERYQWIDADGPEKKAGIVVLMKGKKDGMVALEVGFWDTELGWVDGDGEAIPFEVTQYFNVFSISDRPPPEGE